MADSQAVTYPVYSGMPPEYYWLNPPSIIVDDSDPAIQYTGDWNGRNENETLTDWYHKSLPLFNTLHVLQIFNGSFSYNFTGLGISVYAATIVNSGYTTKCFLDGNLLSPPSNTPSGEGLLLCSAFGLHNNTIHTISVSVSVAPLDQQTQNTDPPLFGFALDYFLIQPSNAIHTTQWDNGNQDIYLPLMDMVSGANIHTASTFGMFFYNTNFQIANISHTWEFHPDNGLQTLTDGSQFNLTFTGTCLWWYGYVATTISEDSHATYTIDGGEPVEFNPYGKAGSPSQKYLFRTPVLQYATHLLTVTMIGHENNESLPLTLQALIIQKAAPAPNGTSAPLPPLPPLQSTTPSTRRGKLESIAGGIGGGVVFLLLLASGLCLLMRRKQRRQQYMQTGAQSTAVVPEPFPISSEVTIPIIVPRKARTSQQIVETPSMQLLHPQASLAKWSRRHTTGASLERMPSSSSPMMEVGSTVSLPLIPDVSQRLPMDTDTTNRESDAQIGDASSSTSQNPFISTGFPGAEGEREEDSGLRMAFVPVLPPLYTTH